MTVSKTMVVSFGPPFFGAVTLVCGCFRSVGWTVTGSGLKRGTVGRETRVVFEGVAERTCFSGGDDRDVCPDCE